MIKTVENTTHVAAANIIERQHDQVQAVPSAGKLPAAAHQAKLQKMANASTQVKQLKTLQAMADNRPRSPKITAPAAGVAQRTVDIQYALTKIEGANRLQVLHFLKATDKNYKTGYHAEVMASPALSDALDEIIQSHKNYPFGFLEAGSLMRTLRDRALIVGGGGGFAEQRAALLEEIRETFFKGKKPESLLYLGAGADVNNPLVGTRTSGTTLVDMAEFDTDLIKERIRVYYGPQVRIEETSEAEKVVALTVRSEDNKVLQKIDLKRMGYEAFLDASHESFDVLMDKDSWLQEAGGRTVGKFAAKLKEKGIWVSNYGLGGKELAEVFDMVGMVDVTDKLQAPFNQATFGNSNLRIRQKQAHFHEQAFNILAVFVNEINDSLSYIGEEGYEFPEAADKSAAKSQVATAFGKALTALILLPDCPEPLPLKFTLTIRHIMDLLEQTPVEPPVVAVIHPEVTYNGFQLANIFPSQFVADQEPVSPQTGPEHVIYRHNNGAMYYLVSVENTHGNWKTASYKFKLP